MGSDPNPCPVVSRECHGLYCWSGGVLEYDLLDNNREVKPELEDRAEDILKSLDAFLFMSWRAASVEALKKPLPSVGKSSTYDFMSRWKLEDQSQVASQTDC